MMKSRFLRFFALAIFAGSLTATPVLADRYQDPYYKSHGRDDYRKRPSIPREEDRFRTYSYVSKVQRELAKRGYYRGRINGDLNVRTRHSIREYQKDHRQRPTGRIDRTLLRSLKIRY